MVLPSTSLGGVQTIVRALIEHLPPWRYEIHIAAPKNGPMYADFQNLGAVMHEIPATVSSRSSLAPVLHVRSLLNGQRFHLVHAHNAKAGLWVALATSGHSVPVVYTGHDWRFNQKSSILSRQTTLLVERLICGRSAMVTFVTRNHERRIALKYRLAPSERMRVIINRIDVERYGKAREQRLRARRNLGIPLQSLVVGTVGRLTQQKAPEVFVATAAHLADTRVRFLWVGDGPLRLQMLKSITAAGLLGRFTLAGDRLPAELPALFGAMDVFLLTSHYEGLPVAVLEAMAARTAVVASAVGGVPDVVAHGVTGWLIQPGDSAQASQCIMEALGNPATYARVTDAAFDLVSRHYSPPSVMAWEYDRLYQELSMSG